MNAAFDQTDPKSIELYARKLEGKSLRNALKEKGMTTPAVNDRDRGNFGSLLERNYFDLPVNVESVPDFTEAGVELKATPVKRLRNGNLVSKERLVFGMIDFMKIHKEEFESSAFLSKNALVLLVFYLHEQKVNVLDYIIQLARLWGVPEADFPIIKNDWEKIVNKIREGKAHEITSSDTLYLEACTKAANNKARRPQPFSDEMAKPRALALKAKYMSELFRQLSEKKKKDGLDIEPIVKSLAEYKKGKTFENIVTEKFSPFLGLPVSEVRKKLGLIEGSIQKDQFAWIARSILNVKTKRIEEFEKAGVVMKTIQLKKSGMPKEDMSFPFFQYNELINEEWDVPESDDPEAEAELKQHLQQRFFFVVFRCENNCKKQEERILEKVMFWNMPEQDLENHAHKVWEETIKRIKAGKADQLPKKSENPVVHVRPHAKNAADTIPTPKNGMLVKKCFWLDKKYIKKQLGS